MRSVSDFAQEYGIFLSKLFQPKVPLHHISREHLFHRFAQNIQNKLTLVVAPAGYGKSTLVSSWADNIERPVGWLSLDQEDNNPQVFLTNLIACLYPFINAIGESLLSSIWNAKQVPMEMYISTLIRQIETLEYPIVLVLDDYHLIDNPEIHSGMEYFLQRLPRQIHLVISSRQFPPFSLLRLQANQEVNFFDASDLRFSNEEIHRFFQKITGLTLSLQELDIISKLTEGWVAALQMICLSSGESHLTRIIRELSGSNRYIMDYFTEEVLRRQTRDDLNFLMKTSILDRLTAPLCDRVLERSDSQVFLDKLEKKILFLLPLDSQRQWYRYHHLFAELLRTKLEKEQPATFKRVHRLASEWLLEAGIYYDAIRHALKAGEKARAAKIILERAISFWVNGKVGELYHFFELFPNQDIFSNLDLAITYTFTALLMGNFSITTKGLNSLEKMLDEMGESPEKCRALGKVHTIRAILATDRTHGEEAIYHAKQALQILGEDEPYWRLTSKMASGMGHRISGNFGRAIITFNEALEVANRHNYNYYTILNSRWIGEIQVLQGDLAQAEKTCADVLRTLPGNESKLLPETCHVILPLAEIYYEKGELERADEAAPKAIHLGEVGGFIRVVVAAQILLARVRLAQGKVKDARKVLEAAKDTIRIYDVKQMLSQIEAMEALQDLESHPDRTEAWLHKNGGFPIAAPYAYSEAWNDLIFIRILMQKGEDRQVLKLIRQLFEIYKRDRVYQFGMRAQILRVLLLLKANEYNEALAVLEEVLSFSMDNGFVQIFLEHGQELYPLLVQEIEKRNSSTGLEAQKLLLFVQYLVSRIEKEHKSARKLGPNINLLTEREQQILRQLADGCTYDQIALSLQISINTVRFHIKNLYRKLGTGNCVQAVKTAKALRII